MFQMKYPFYKKNQCLAFQNLRDKLRLNFSITLNLRAIYNIMYTYIHEKVNIKVRIWFDE